MKKPINLPLEISADLSKSLYEQLHAAVTGGVIAPDKTKAIFSKIKKAVGMPTSLATLEQWGNKQSGLQAIEQAITTQGFAFDLAHCCFVRKMGKESAHELRLFRSEGTTPTAALYVNGQRLVQRWPLLDPVHDVARAVALASALCD